MPLIYFVLSDGRQEKVMFDKITSRIQKLCYGLNVDFVDPVGLPSPNNNDLDIFFKLTNYYPLSVCNINYF